MDPAKGNRRADPDQSVRTAREFFQVAGRFLGLGNDAGTSIVKPFTRLGQAELARAALEELDAKGVLQFLDLPAHQGLGDSAVVRRDS